MAPGDLMTTTVTITRSQPVTWDTDRLGRPTRVDTSTVTTRCRLARQTAVTFDPNTAGHQTSLFNLYLPSGSGIRDSDRLTIDGRTYTPVTAPDRPTSPLTGAGYDMITVRLIEDAT